MTVDLAGRGARLRMLTVMAALSVVTASCQGGSGEPTSHVVSGSSPREGWKTVEYRGVRVDVPAEWSRANPHGCSFTFEHWVPPDADACNSDEGVAFYWSATFDPANGPGVRREQAGGTKVSGWSGYVRVGDQAVYAADPDRAVVARVLDSAHVSGG